MSKRYGISMKTYGVILPRTKSLDRLTVLSKPAKQRLKWMDFYHSHGRNARLTCRHFGISPDVFYRWKRRYKPRNLSSLEDDTSTRTPAKLRQPETDPAITQRVKELREQYSRWGKKKLWKLLAREGLETSISTVGRTLSRLRVQGRLNEPAIVKARLAGATRRKKRPYAIRKPWGYRPRLPGDLVGVDTVHLYPADGQKRYQFTASDHVAKHTARISASTITSTAATRVLDAIEDRFPYPVKAIQIYGGSEFKAAFEAECQKRGIILYVLPVKSPKLNGIVERMQRTSREEIYDLEPVPLTVAEHNELLVRQDYIYNYIRPHDALDLLTPNEYYVKELTPV